MRTMYDAINPELIPLSANPQMVAGYVNGYWPSYNGYTDSHGHYVPSIRQRFPNAIHVSITVNAQGNAQVADCETSDLTPAECPPWVLRQRSLGTDPTIYMNETTWPYVINEFFNQKVAEPHYWVAKYDNVAQLMPGAIAKQYGGVTNQYDLSIVADFWPGIDGEDNMDATQFAQLLNALVQMQGEPTHTRTGSLLNILNSINANTDAVNKNTAAVTDAVNKSTAAVVAAIQAINPGSGGTIPPSHYVGTITLNPQ